jgi:hypothetical protein
MARPPHNINMVAIKNEDGLFLKKPLACFFLTNLTGRLRLDNISYSFITGYR